MTPLIHPSAIPQPTRCTQMVGALRRAYYYSEKRARDIVFTSCERTLEKHASKPILLARLIRDTSQDARHAGASCAYQQSSWGIAAGAAINAMLHARVLLDTRGNVIEPGLKAHSTAVGGLLPTYRDLTEAYLVEYLIRDLGDVGIRDHRALAHALFRRFDHDVPMDQSEDRVVVLLSNLVGRVTLDSNGHYRALTSCAIYA